MSAVKGRCMKCKEQREMKNPKFELNARGAPIARGQCVNCGTNMYLILSREEGLKRGLKVGQKSTASKSKSKSRKSKSGGRMHARKSKGADDDHKPKSRKSKSKKSRKHQNTRKSKKSRKSKSRKSRK